MTQATLTINSRNYGAWSLRGWLLCKIAGLDPKVAQVPLDDPSVRAELMLLSPSFLVPRLSHDGVEVWDTWAIAEYLAESFPKAGLWPEGKVERAHARAVSGEMHSGFANLRSALPLNLKARFPGFKVWEGARADIERITEIWRDCLNRYGGPFLFGKISAVDAMYAPVCARFYTYDVALDSVSAGYCRHMLSLPWMKEWTAAAANEDDDVLELEAEF